MQNVHYVCLPCRYDTHGHDRCPFCGGDLLNFGYHFKPPPRSNVQQWKKIELHRRTIGRHAVGCFYGKFPRYGWCTCSGGLASLRVPADIKSKYGLRRSGRRHYAREESQFRGIRPPLRPWMPRR